MKDWIKEDIKKEIINEQLEGLSTNAIIEIYSEITSEFIYDDLETMLNELCSTPYDGYQMARTVQSLASDYYMLDGYGNVEDYTEGELRDELIGYLKADYKDDIANGDFDDYFDFSELEELEEQADEMNEKEGLYEELRAKQEKETGDFVSENMFFAFSEEQFNEGLEKLNTTKEQIVSTGFGGYVLDTKKDDYIAMLKRHTQEIEDAKKNEDFLTGMLYYELNNHEYGYTRELEDTFDACGITYEEYTNDATIQNAVRVTTNLIERIDNYIN